MSLLGFMAACSADDEGKSPFGGAAASATGATGAVATVGGAPGSGGNGGISISTGGVGAVGENGPPVAIIRDFSWNFVDMEPCSHIPGATCASGDDLEIVGAGQEGIAELTPAPTRVPQYAGGADGTLTTSGDGCRGQPCFNFWYVDDAEYNLRNEQVMPFTEDPPGSGNFVFEEPEFFPIDNWGFGNEHPAWPLHNYHFTIEIRLEFTYTASAAGEADQVLVFKGDDDVFVYINNKLALNMGGIHAVDTKELNLTQLAPALGLVNGQTYPLDFFGAERHVSASYFRIQTNIKDLIQKLE